jgi:ABC-type thiamine transport system ATPase subunit
MNYFSSRIKKLNTYVVVYITVTVGLASIMVSMPDSTLASQGKEQALELAKAFAQEQPIVNATYLYNSGQVVLGNNICIPSY